MTSVSSPATSGDSPLPNKLFGYDVVSRIREDKDAAAKLYAVTDASGQLFALKHVVRKTEQDDRIIAQLQNEYDVSRVFRHPSLRKVLELKVPRRLFNPTINEAALVLEWIDGVPLDQQAPGDLVTLLSIFAHAAAGLASIHHLKLVHCDFKPQNVLVIDQNKAKVIDFGQTCKTGAAKQRVQGTADYITPEQVKCTAVEARTDVYAYGASLYWALTGVKVPTYYTVDKADRDIIKMQKFPTPKDLRPDLPDELSALIMQCLMYNPDRRTADMVTVLNTIKSITQSLVAAAEPARPVAAAPEVRKPQPRRVTDWGL